MNGQDFFIIQQIGMPAAYIEAVLPLFKRPKRERLTVLSSES